MALANTTNVARDVESIHQDIQDKDLLVSEEDTCQFDQLKTAYCQNKLSRNDNCGNQSHHCHKTLQHNNHHMNCKSKNVQFVHQIDETEDPSAKKTCQFEHHDNQPRNYHKQNNKRQCRKFLSKSCEHNHLDCKQNNVHNIQSMDQDNENEQISAVEACQFSQVKGLRCKSNRSHNHGLWKNGCCRQSHHVNHRCQKSSLRSGKQLHCRHNHSFGKSLRRGHKSFRTYQCSHNQH